MIDWQVKIALDSYRERLAEAQRNYDIHEALREVRAGKDVSSRLSRRTGLLLVGLGKRLQRWGGPVDAPQARTR